MKSKLKEDFMTTFHPINMDFEESGQGFPLILLHGFPLNRSIWYPLLPYLNSYLRVILPDLRGFGETPVGNEPSTMRLMAEDLSVLLSKLKIKKCLLAGHSMGGYISLAFANAYPQKLAGLGLVSTQAANDTLEKSQARFKTIENVKKHGTTLLAKDMPAILTHQVELHQPISALISATNPEGIINALKGMADRPDFTETLSEISVPTVIFTGQKDALVHRDLVDIMARLIRRNWVVDVPEGGHMLMMESPEMVAKGLLDLAQLIK
jgi:3-oxoadipate enol-lactonase